ncbi:response regulator [Tumidithrix elongata RA019]|uniref:Response regulator n=1 Tax=Tumidithrix elongata BACA0141 TaxID=2716417 RepID=A0AAW9Q4V4_9CYAN|nr:response regulator [Tumidithrix elongata RA019]
MTVKKILIVDDEERIREVVSMCLTKLAKWEVIAVATAMEAIQKALEWQPHAILLDVSMPNMNGLEMLQQLQGHPRTVSIPVIFLTAKVQPNEKLLYQQLGIAGLIIKPFNPVEIAKEISHLLGWT